MRAKYGTLGICLLEWEMLTVPQELRPDRIALATSSVSLWHCYPLFYPTVYAPLLLFLQPLTKLPLPLNSCFYYFCLITCYVFNLILPLSFEINHFLIVISIYFYPNLLEKIKRYLLFYFLFLNPWTILYIISFATGFVTSKKN